MPCIAGMIPSFLPLPVLSMMLPKFNPSAFILQQKYLVLVPSASLLICPADYFMTDNLQIPCPVCMVDISVFFCMSCIPIMIRTEHLHNNLLYFDTPIKDYVYTWNIQAPNYTDTEICCYG
jgi:hypothetical protein